MIFNEEKIFQVAECLRVACRRPWGKLVVFSAIFVFCLKGLAGEDVWFHLATGRHIFDQLVVHFYQPKPIFERLTGVIPIKDVFSFSAEGQSWVNQNWLADLVMFMIFKAGEAVEGIFLPLKAEEGGMTSLVVFFSLLFFSVFLVLERILRRLSGSEKLSLLVTFLAAAVAVGRFQARPEPGSYLFLLLVMLALLEFETKKRLIIILPVIFLLWVNWQAGFVAFGFWIWGVFFLKKVLLLGRKGWKVLLAEPILPAGIFSGVAIFFNPSGLAGPAYFLMVQPRYLVEDFTEWGSLVRIITDKHFYALVADDKFLIIGYLIFLPVFLTIFLWWLKEKLSQRLVKNADICILLLGFPFIFLPFFANRFASLAVIFISVLTAYFWGSFPPEKKRVLPVAGRLALVLTAALFFGLRLSLIPPKITPYQKANPYREEALAFLEKNQIAGNMFNPLEDGGYLIWRNPERKVFIDGRLDVYTASGVYEDYRQVYRFPPAEGWEKILEKYKIEYLLLPGWQKEPMATIRQSGRYDLVFWSDYFFILVKKDGENRQWVEKNALRLVEPFRGDDYPSDNLAEVREELEKLRELSPISGYLATSLGAVLQQMGEEEAAIREYERAIKLRPEEGMTRLALGNLYFKKGECTEAEKQFQAASRQGKLTKIYAMRNLGILWRDCRQDLFRAYYYFREYLSLAEKETFARQSGLTDEAIYLVKELEKKIKNQ